MIEGHLSLDEDFAANLSSLGQIVDTFLSYRIKKDYNKNDKHSSHNDNEKAQENLKISREWDILFEQPPDLGYLI